MVEILVAICCYLNTYLVVNIMQSRKKNKKKLFLMQFVAIWLPASFYAICCNFITKIVISIVQVLDHLDTDYCN